MISKTDPFFPPGGQNSRCDSDFNGLIYLVALTRKKKSRTKRFIQELDHFTACPY